MIQWRIYYADGSTFDSSQGEPWEAPATRVLIILVRDPDASGGVTRVQDGEYYTWKNQRWYAATFDALMFYWFIDKFDHPRACLAGEMVTNKLWLKTTRRVAVDKDFYE